MKHNTPEFKELAYSGLILLSEVGSTAHGISVNDQDDLDLMGVTIEPPEYVIGLSKFEQYEHHTAWEREGGRANRSGPGDTDITIYSLRKYMRLALQGNPSVLVPLYAPRSAYHTLKHDGLSLVASRERIISKQSGHRFLGYLTAQKERLMGMRSPHVQRPELVEKYGYDTKFAGHAIRLGYEGIELMETGKLTLPMVKSERDLVIEIRRGEHSKGKVLRWIEGLEGALQLAIKESHLREQPDWEWGTRFLVDHYQRFWSERPDMHY